jgi:hypothetical protein
MAVAVAASPAGPVSAPMLAQVLVLACGLAMRGPAAPAGSNGVARCPNCADDVGSCAADSVRALTVRRARSAAHDGDWNAAARQWREALLMDEHVGADWLAMADVLMNAERHREAAAAYQRAIQVDARLRERATPIESAGVAGPRIASPYARTSTCASIGALTGTAGDAATATAMD